MFGATISKTDSLLRKLGNSDLIEEALIKAVRESVLRIHATAVKSIQERSGGGTPEIRYNPKRIVTPSPPGSPPNTDTGRLVQGILFEFEDSGRRGIVGTNVKYGPALEFGTEDMEARPWLGPAVEKSSEFVSKSIKDSVNEGLLKAFGVKSIVKSIVGFSKSSGIIRPKTIKGSRGRVRKPRQKRIT